MTNNLLVELIVGSTACLLFIICAGKTIIVPATEYTSEDSSSHTCSSEDTIYNETLKTRAIMLANFFSRTHPCSCGGSEWTRVAHLDMSDTNQHCPSNWRQATSPVRGCGRTSKEALARCDSVMYPVSNRNYSSVCGKMAAYQRGRLFAFSNSIYQPEYYSLEENYLSGLSVTHGPAGNRTHIWSFVGADSELNTAYPLFICPCTNTDISWPFEVPKFVGMDYFCDTGNDGPGKYTQYYTEDPLWDGEGCGPASTCCFPKSSPWFCKHLPRSTSDDLEIRLCNYVGDWAEDIIVTHIDIYIK